MTQENQQAKLVSHVLQRAEYLNLQPGHDVVVGVTGVQPWVIRHHPTGRVFYVYSNFEAYKRGVHAGEHRGSNASFGPRPVSVHDWDVPRLEDWLRAHRHGVPEY